MIGVVVLVGSSGCSSASTEESVCGRLRNITDAPLDDDDKVVTDLERVRVEGFDEVGRLGLEAAISQVRSEFDRFNAGDSENGWSTQSVTDWAEVHCGGEFATMRVIP